MVDVVVMVVRVAQEVLAVIRKNVRLSLLTVVMVVMVAMEAMEAMVAMAAMELMGLKLLAIISPPIVRQSLPLTGLQMWVQEEPVETLVLLAKEVLVA